jgi:hypothetical protein
MFRGEQKYLCTSVDTDRTPARRGNFLGHLFVYLRVSALILLELSDLFLHL